MGFIELITRQRRQGEALESIGQAFTGERSSPRYETTVYVRYDGCGPLVARRANLGIGGFCFEGERLFAEGTEVELMFRLPNSQRTIRARGEVLGHTTCDGYLGVRGRFVELSFTDERRLARWLDDQTLGQLAPCACQVA